MSKRDPYQAAKAGITRMLDSVDHQWLRELAAKKKAALAPAPTEAPAEDDSALLAALDGA